MRSPSAATSGTTWSWWAAATPTSRCSRAGPWRPSPGRASPSWWIGRSRSTPAWCPASWPASTRARSPRDRRAAAGAARGGALHRRAGHRLDAGARRLRPGRPAPIAYDTVSFDVGSTVAGLGLPGVPSTRSPRAPSAGSSARVDELPAAARAGARAHRRGRRGRGRRRGGLRARGAARREGRAHASRCPARGGPRVLPGYAASAAARVQRAAAARGIAIRAGTRVTRGRPARAPGRRRAAARRRGGLGGGRRRLPLFDGSGLETDEGGFVRIRPTLQCLGHDEVFAVGDCAAWTAGPGLAKAGVYAVRQGPVLAHNLLARLRGERLAAYRPQRDFLSLLNLGDGRAIGTKWGARSRAAGVRAQGLDRPPFRAPLPGARRRRRRHAGLRRAPPCPAGTCSAAAARPRWANPR